MEKMGVARALDAKKMATKPEDFISDSSDDESTDVELTVEDCEKSLVRL